MIVNKPKYIVIPAQAGIHNHCWWSLPWIPAFAGMTDSVV